MLWLVAVFPPCRGLTVLKSGKTNFKNKKVQQNRKARKKVGNYLQRAISIYCLRVTLATWPFELVIPVLFLHSVCMWVCEEGYFCLPGESLPMDRNFPEHFVSQTVAVVVCGDISSSARLKVAAEYLCWAPEGESAGPKFSASTIP